MLPPIKVFVNKDDIKFALFDMPEVISNEIREKGLWYPNLVFTISKILSRQKVGTVIDVGAGFGSISIPARLYTEVQHTYHAFEPVRILHQQLCANILLNFIDNIHTYNIALGEDSRLIQGDSLEITKLNNHGIFSFNQRINEVRGIVPSTKKEYYEFRPLDSYGFRDVRFVKLSAPGMELEVLRGAKNTIQNNSHPPISFEYWADDWYKEDFKAILDYLEQIGYTSFVNVDGYYIAFKTDAQADFYTSDDKVEDVGDFYIREHMHDRDKSLATQKVYKA